MTHEEYNRLTNEIMEARTTEELERLRDRILEFPDDGDRKSLFHTLAQYAADVGLL
jgi:hypothetical protein